MGCASSLFCFALLIVQQAAAAPGLRQGMYTHQKDVVRWTVVAQLMLLVLLQQYMQVQH